MGCLDLKKYEKLPYLYINFNEVIANRAIEILGCKRGAKKVHTNDHVNMA